ncbi:MAG: DUF1559 domain-containing protein, partial [Planctomycetales bacterium]|nr:DUF1559 domain-containing protein [Planctomycetales bacterium]
MRKRGMTLLEVIVAIAIVVILLAMLLPAIQFAREAGRRTACQSNLRQLGLAMGQYESTFKIYPPGAGRKNF